MGEIPPRYWRSYVLLQPNPWSWLPLRPPLILSTGVTRYCLIVSLVACSLILVWRGTQVVQFLMGNNLTPWLCLAQSTNLTPWLCLAQSTQQRSPSSSTHLRSRAHTDSARPRRRRVRCTGRRCTAGRCRRHPTRSPSRRRRAATTGSAPCCKDQSTHQVEQVNRICTEVLSTVNLLFHNSVDRTVW